MSIPNDLLYSSEHEWVLIEPTGEARCGVTAFAADQLGDVVHIELPSVGEQVAAGDACGEIESTKSVSELFSPVSGTVTSINDEVLDAPEAVNTDPYGSGWLFVVTPSEPVEGLLDPAGYERYVEEQEA